MNRVVFAVVACLLALSRVADCYEILGVERTATVQAIKKAYRKASVQHHPDKNLDKDTTEIFRKIQKAYEVLSGNESRPLFDYYLDHPKDYFKVSGQHLFTALPKSDARLVVIIFVLLLSWLLRSIQYSKYERVVKYLKNAALNNLGPKNGGNEQTAELHKRATDLYEETMKNSKEYKPKSSRASDPAFLKIVDQVVREVKIEGGYRKPEWSEFLAWQIVVCPYSLYQWWRKYHRRYLSKEPLSLEDLTEMAREKVGLGSWEQLTAEERDDLIAREVWREEVYTQWVAEREEEDYKKLTKMYKATNKMMKRRNKDMGGGAGGDMPEPPSGDMPPPQFTPEVAKMMKKRRKEMKKGPRSGMPPMGGGPMDMDDDMFVH